MPLDTETSRRGFLQRCGALAASAGALPTARGAPAEADWGREPRRLALAHTHTGEQIDLVYAVDAVYVPEALEALNHFLRDHYSGEVGTIAPAIFDQLHRLQRAVRGARPFEVISGYRCPATNTALRETRGGGVARHSLHMEGRAIDVRLPGVALTDLHAAALSLRAGGVGYYPGERFVHLDNGPLRRW
jgi:uncharacterized protein YcbK (DUF882 family)